MTTKCNSLPRVWSWGFGKNSTVGIERDIKLNRPIDLIVATNPGNEMDFTYSDVIPFYKERWESMGYDVVILKRDYKLYDHFFDKKQVPLGWVNPYCSSHFKRDVIRPYLRKRFHEVIECIGFTYSEKSRSLTKTPKWLTREYPLITDEITEDDCIRYFNENNLLATGKSACWFCPNKPLHHFQSLSKDQIKLLVLLEDNAEGKNGKPKPTLRMEGSIKKLIVNQTSLEDWGDFNCSEYCYT